MISASVIFYALYLAYIFWIYMGWEFTLNTETIIWAAFPLLITLFIVISLTSILYSCGVKVPGLYSINGIHLGMALFIIVLVFTMILYYQYYTTNKIRSDIIIKLRNTTFPSISYQYGRDSQEIAIKLGITEYDIVPRDEPRSLQEIWAQLMSRKLNNDIINKIISEILGDKLHDTIDISYNLFWYLCISEHPFSNNLTRREISYISSSDISDLLSLLGPTYFGSKDRASLIFTALSGQIIPNVETGERYEKIKQYNPRIIYNLAFIQNQIIDHNQGIYSLYGPYKFLSLQQESQIESIIANVDVECRNFRDNYDSLVDRLGIGPINNLESMTEDERIIHLQGELSLYHNVIARGPEIKLPPKLVGKNKEEIKTTLSKYTNIEIINAYEPRSKWNSRFELLGIICDDMLSVPRWSLKSVLNCNNDDTINVITVEKHGDIDKYDIQDPTLSYGVHKNYRCFQSTELEGSFSEYDGVFLFRVPDWSGETVDPITNTLLRREFPLESIKQLKILLEEEKENYNVKGLISKIGIGLEYMKSVAMQTRHLKQTLDDFTFEQKRIVQLYLGWMFTYSMWMRFWKGPGTPWPLIKVNVTRERDRNREHRSSPQERDEYIFIQESVRTSIIELYENDIILRDWIEGLPTIYYDFDSRETSCATHTIKSIMDQIAIGDYCMGFGSDTILKTAYYYITSLLDFSQGPLLDGFLSLIIPQLQDLEYTVVTTQLQTSEPNTLKYQILTARLNVLRGEIPKQPSFNPRNYQNNVHVE